MSMYIYVFKERERERERETERYIYPYNTELSSNCIEGITQDQLFLIERNYICPYRV
jgi:hypothetical protein